MKKTPNSIARLQLTVRVLILLAVVIILFWLFFMKKDNSLELQVNRDINVTPEQIQSIRQIGEWEFLSVSNEELVDTVRRGFLSNDELVRIYYGTLRLGINLHQAAPDWLQAHGDSVVVTLPPVVLLDRDFIDETRTQSFYETGRWTPAAREQLYKKAYRQMLSHSLTPQNLESARQNAEAQFRQMMQAMGFRHIEIKFEK